MVYVTFFSSRSGAHPGTRTTGYDDDACGIQHVAYPRQRRQHPAEKKHQKPQQSGSISGILPFQIQCQGGGTGKYHSEEDKETE